jgi:hypothetical protein
MSFSILKIKDNILKVVLKEDIKELNIEELPYGSITYKFNDLLYKKRKDIVFLELYLENKYKITDFINTDEYWYTKLQKHIKVLKTTKILPTSNNLSKLIPEEVLVEYYKNINKILEKIIEKVPRPKNYNFYCELMALNFFLAGNKNLLPPARSCTTVEELREWKNFNNKKKYIKYELFSTKTGRLKVSPGYFNVLNLKKQERKFIIPKNDFFLELDFNGADPRVFLALTNQEQPKEDIYSFFGKILGSPDRNSTKKELLSNLYGTVTNHKICEFYNRKEIIDKFYDGDKCVNFFGREIEADDYHKIRGFGSRSSVSPFKIESGCYVVVQPKNTDIEKKYFLVTDRKSVV